MTLDRAPEDILREEQERRNQVPDHDAFKEQRKSVLYWLRTTIEELDVLDKLEDILPSFVRRRYRFSSVGPHHLSLSPADTVDENDVQSADALHADVNKLFHYLVGKTKEDIPAKPERKVIWNGSIAYSFSIRGLPGFEGGLTVDVGGLPAGSACHITKTVKGTRTVEDVEYTMVCDDEVEVPA